MKNLRGKKKEKQERKKSSPNKQTGEIVKKRKKSKRKYLLYYIIFFILLLALASALSLTVLFKITTISLNSDAPYSDSDIVAYLGVKEGDNLLRASEKLAEEKIAKSFPYVDTVTFKRKLPDTLNVTVTREIPAVSSESEGRTVILNDRGKVLEVLASENNKGLPRVCGIDTDGLLPGEYIKEEEKERLSILINLQECLRNEGISADVIDVRDLSAIRVLYDGRVDIYMGGTFEHDYKCAFARKAIDTSVNDDFVGVLDVSRRPTARLRPVNIFLSENWLYPRYLLSDYEKTLTVKPNAIVPKDAYEEEKKKQEEEEALANSGGEEASDDASFQEADKAYVPSSDVSSGQGGTEKNKEASKQ